MCWYLQFHCPKLLFTCDAEEKNVNYSLVMKKKYLNHFLWVNKCRLRILLPQNKYFGCNLNRNTWMKYIIRKILTWNDCTYSLSYRYRKCEQELECIPIVRIFCDPEKPSSNHWYENDANKNGSFNAKMLNTQQESFLLLFFLLFVLSWQ